MRAHPVDHRACARVRMLATGRWLLVVAAAAALSTAAAPAATSSSVVGAIVPSATSLDIAGCQPATAATDFGVVTPGSTVLTAADCTVQFSSSNDTAALRMFQADGAGDAMWHARGETDDTFAGDGSSAPVDIGASTTDKPRVSLVQPDGRITVVFDSIVGDIDGGAVRFDTNGTPLAGWGTGAGVSELVDVSSSTERVFAAVLQPDGGVLMAGFTSAGPGNDMFVARLAPNGMHDTTWAGGDGISDLVNVAGASDDQAMSMHLLDDGSILLVGTTDAGSGNDVVAVKLTADGDLDLSWGGGDGISDVVDVGTASNEEVNDSAVLSDGSILASVRTNANGSNDIAVVRFDETGAHDLSWGGGDGISDIVDVGTSSSEQARSIQVRTDGSIVVSGHSNASGTADMVAVQFTSAGALDLGWGGGDGISDLVSGGAAATDHAWRSLLLPDDRLLQVGYSNALGTYDVMVAALDVNGALDTDWAGDGTFGPLAIGAGIDYALDAALGVDGRVVLALEVQGASSDIAAMRLDADTFDQYVDGVTDWDTAAPSDGAFGACLSSAAGAAVPTWTASAGCPLSDGTHWRAVGVDAAAPSARIATTAAPDPTGGTVALRFGLRVASTQPPGTYLAPITFEVVAPSA